MTETNNVELLEFAKHLHGKCIKLARNIKFNKRQSRECCLVMLYHSLIKLTECLIVLVEQKQRIGVNPVFRNILETYVELKNLDLDAEYVYNMKAARHKTWVKIFKGSKSNKVSPHLRAIFELKKSKNKHKAKLSELKTKGYGPLSVSQRFKRAGMVDEYCSVYSFLSNDVHSNIQALISRHIVRDENDFSVVNYNDERSDRVEPYFLYDTAGLLCDASERIHQIFDTGLVVDVRKLRKKLEDIGKKIQISFDIIQPVFALER